MAKKKQIPAAEDTSTVARLARLETYLLQKEEERVRAEEAKVKKREESKQRQEANAEKRKRRLAAVSKAIAAEVKKVSLPGWSLLDGELHTYHYGSNSAANEMSAMRKAIQAHGSEYEVKVLPGFADSHEWSHDDEGAVTLIRTNTSWLVFGRRLEAGDRYAPCTSCAGTGFHFVNTQQK